jgi:hypothetical protein
MIVEAGREGGAFRMTTANKKDLKERLAKYRQISLRGINLHGELSPRSSRGTNFIN